MATSRPCLAQLSRTCLNASRSTPTSLSIRLFSTSTPSAGRGSFTPKIQSKKVKVLAPAKSQQAIAAAKKKAPKKKKADPFYKQYDLRNEETFTLLDAMRIIRAWEVGQKPSSVKYELALKLKSLKNGPVIRNRLRLPHPVKTDFRVCVICPPDSKYAEAAKAAGAVLVGEDDVFDAVKEGKIEFDRCICQVESLAKMNKSGIGRVLGPRGLMPSSKLGTVVADPVKTMNDMVGAMEYRERVGVVRTAIGQLGFTPEQMSSNIKAFIDAVKKDMGRISDKIQKDIAEVVLSSTNGPGLPLNGAFKGTHTTVTAKDLSGPA